MTRRLRLGVIGAGSWAVSSHLPNFELRRDEVDFVAVARKGPELLERVQRQFGFALASEDYRDVLEAGVDVCLVASPTSHHHEHARAALESGAHVLVEKPFTIAPGDAWDLVDTAQRLDRHAVIAFGWNYKPMVRELRRLVAERGIGEVEQVSIHMASATRKLLSNTGSYADAAADISPESRTWTDARFSGGGYGQAQLTHALGLALWATGLRGAEVFALMAAPLGAPVELHDAISIRFANGAVGAMAGGSCHEGANDNKHQLAVRAIGSQGQFHIDLEREAAWLWTEHGRTDIRLDLPADAGAYDCDGPVDVMIDLAQGRPAENESPAELGARTVEILDAAYRSASSGRLEPVRSG